MRKLGSFVMLVLASQLVCIVPAAAAEVSPAAAREQEALSSVNAARASAGMSSLVIDADLTSIARTHSRDMAASGVLQHNTSLPSQVKGWRSIGENVGAGPDVATIDDQFLASEAHRANVLGSYRKIGIGVIEGDDGMVWMTQVYVDPAGQAARNSSRTTVRPKPRPALPRRVDSTESSRARVAPVAQQVSEKKASDAARAAAVRVPEGTAERAVALLERMTDEEV